MFDKNNNINSSVLNKDTCKSSKSKTFKNETIVMKNNYQDNNIVNETLFQKFLDSFSSSKDFIVKSACEKNGKKYLTKESWQILLLSLGYFISCLNTKRVYNSKNNQHIGYSSTAKIVDSQGKSIAEFQGFLGINEVASKDISEAGCRSLVQIRAIEQVCYNNFSCFLLSCQQEKFSLVPEEKSIDSILFDKVSTKNSPTNEQLLKETITNKNKENQTFLSKSKTKNKDENWMTELSGIDAITDWEEIEESITLEDSNFFEEDENELDLYN